MNKPTDFCKLFSAIEADPYAPVHLTVGQHLAAAYHVRECAGCAELVERVAAKYPDQSGIDVGLN